MALPRSTAQTRADVAQATDLRRYEPRSLSMHSWWRFRRHRRAELIRRIGGGAPDERQALVIDQLIKSQWASLVAEREAEAAADGRIRAEAMRVASEARRQVLLWHREMTAATLPPPAAEKVDPMAAFREAVAAIKRQGGKAA